MSAQLNRPIRTRFRYGFPTRVNLATHRKLAGSFFKRHAVTRHKASLRRIVGTRFQVLFHSPPGVLFTFPSRYLSAIGHQGVFRLNGWSRQIHTEFQGFRVTWGHAPELAAYTYGAITLYGPAFQPASTSPQVSHSAPVRQNWSNGPTTPHLQPLPGITQAWFGLFRFRSPLLSESLLFSLPVGTEMFHFPTFPPLTLCVQVRVTGHDSSWVSPFGHPRITARLPTPRGLSQAPTSFIGSWCQGIHHVPLVACLNNVKTTQLQRPTTTPQSDAMAIMLIAQTHTTHPPPPHRTTQREVRQSPGGSSACLMLASTIQISNTNPTNPHRCESLAPPGKGGTPEQPANHHRSAWSNLIPQDPTACHDPPPPTIHPGSTPPHTKDAREPY